MTAAPREDLSILIPAAGQGDRLGHGPKAFLELRGRPLVAWLADKARRVATEVVIAAPPDRLEEARALSPGCRCIAGGATHQESVARLAQAATRPTVLVQIAARPFVTEQLLRRVADAARDAGAAGAFLFQDVPVALVDGARVVQDLPADRVGLFQAPQAFDRALLAGVLARAAAEGWTAQTTLQLVLRAGLPVQAVPGEKTNIKLTTPEDLLLASALGELLA